MNIRILLLTLGTFAIGTDGFMIAGILPSIADDVGTSLAVTGQLITAFALAYALGSPILATLTSNFKRKNVLMLALIVFVVSNGISAMVPSIGWLFVTRITAALAAALYTPTAVGVGASLASEEMRGRAISIVNSGQTVAIVLGVPFGTWIGNALSWRITFLIVAVLGVIGVLGILLALPKSIASPPSASLKKRLLVLKNPQVLLGLIALIIASLGGYSLYDYVVPMLHDITLLEPEKISILLVLMGLASVLGNILGGYGSDHFGSLKTLGASVGLFGFSMVALSVLSLAPTSNVLIILASIAVILWGIAGWGLNAPMSSYLIAKSPTAPPVVLSLVGSALYLGIALGGVIGGLVLQYSSIGYLGYVGAIFEVVALLLIFLCSRLKSPATSVN